MKYEIFVEPKPDVLDPEARAIGETLKRLGFPQIQEVKVSKRYVLTMSEANDKVAEKIVSEHLANPVSEQFTLRKL
ncbi:MAG: phosphoribosylformylglycinamidine synthase subunit PurS [Oligoflexales bacterium]